MYYVGAKPRRVFLLDELRGFCILLMVLYHGAYDLVYLFDIDIPIFHWPVLAVAQPVVAGIFVFIAGIASQYSHNNVRRGLLALGAGLVLTAFTWYWMREQMIIFGILHLIGSSILLFALLRPLLDRVLPLVGVVVCSLLYAAVRPVQEGWIGLFGLHITLPKGLYGAPGLLLLGMPAENFLSFDYFPLLPWFFLFLAGAFAGVWFVQNDMPRWMYKPHARWLATVGRHSLSIYLLHQPVLYGIFYLFFHIFNKVVS